MSLYAVQATNGEGDDRPTWHYIRLDSIVCVVQLPKPCKGCRVDIAGAQSAYIDTPTANQLLKAMGATPPDPNRPGESE